MRLWRTMATQTPHATSTAPAAAAAARDRHIRLRQPSGAGRRRGPPRKAEIHETAAGSDTASAFVDLSLLEGGAKTAPASRAKKSSNKAAEAAGELPLGLDRSLARRRSWTPVREEEAREDCTPVIAHSAEPNEYTGTQNERYSIASRVFGSLKDDFAFCDDLSAPPVRHHSASVEPMMRRRLELGNAISKPNPRPAPSPVPSPPKKRIRTITEKATALYRQESGNAEVSTLAEDTANPAGLGQTVAVDPGKKVRKKRVSRRKGVPRSPLLSPTAARRVFDRQEMVFGTSSQLMREDSPTVIRDLQTALELSLQSASVPAAMDCAASSTCSARSSAARSTTISVNPSSRRRLWEAAFRDENGKTAVPEVIDLTDSPFAKDAPLDQAGASSPRDMVSQGRLKPAASILPLAACPVRPSAATLVQQRSYASMSPRASLSPVRRGKHSAALGPAEGEVEVSEPAKGIEVPAAQAKAPTMPDYAQWTDEQLKEAIKGYGFKTMRNRKNMIARLKKCWESLQPTQARSDTTTLGYAATETSASARSALRPPESGTQDGGAEQGVSRRPPAVRTKAAAARSGKDASTTTSASTSSTKPAPPPTTTPPRSHQAHSASASASTVATPTLPKRDTEPPPFDAIQAAILSAPATNDAANLSWREKLLLYDPVIIEDLTAWLNSGALGAVGFDEEVSPVLVRDWCESRSVCCLWRLNLRGVARSRF